MEPFITYIIYLFLLHFSELNNFFLKIFPSIPSIIDRTNLRHVAAVAHPRVCLGCLVSSLRFKRTEIAATNVTEDAVNNPYKLLHLVRVIRNIGKVFQAFGKLMQTVQICAYHTYSICTCSFSYSQKFALA